MNEDGTLNVWTIYDHPTDYPDVFVARRFVASPGGVKATPDVLESAELDDLRIALELAGKFMITRAEEDDPNIMETWI